MANTPVVSANWRIDSVSTPSAGRRSVAAATEDAHLAAVLGNYFEVEQTFRAASPRRRGADPLPPLDIALPVEPGAPYLLAVRHEPSGAISFHAPAPGTANFVVQFPEEPDESARRSIVSKVVKAVVLKVAGKLADVAAPWIASEVEELIWRAKGLPTGWLHVTPSTLASGKLGPADFSVIHDPAERCLLLLHGTFSNAAGAFQGLASVRTASGAQFFESVAPLYGDRMFAFNHFSVSKTPEENARELLAALPRAATFDVITHSRGGLVLRNLVERAAALGAGASNFQLGKAVLVASPNQGTPLATPDRFDKLIGWWANLLELFPENPFTTTADYVATSLTFIARHIVGSQPGLDSMNSAGAQMAALNAPPSAPAGAYSILTSNYQPRGGVLARVLDLGVDGIFGMANDLVVPAEGSWQVDQRNAWPAGAQIGCFGVNLSSAAAPDGVIHTTYFSQPESIDFLLNTLLAKPLGIAPIDPDIHLPFLLRRGAARVLAPAVAPSRASESASAPGFHPTPLAEADDVLHLFLISPNEGASPGAGPGAAILLATYRNARVVETISLSAEAAAAGAEPKESLRWEQIGQVNDRIRQYVDGAKGVALPTGDELHRLGVNLFNAMFPASVRRMYDVARVDRGRSGQRLDIVITSMINSVADKPWEFAYDPSRQSFLATEAVNFTRNVLTAVPAEEPLAHPGRPLRILVVVAQPIGLGMLSADQEERVLRRGFQALEDAGLATIEIMLRARIDQLHDRLRNPNIDILHFIGHGEYREKEGEGYLIFENPDGGAQAVSSESLRQVLCQRGIRLIFLNACETGMVGRAQAAFDFNRGVAPKLVAGGVPVLVANQYKVLDVSATEFARHFYWWLALGSTVGDAAREARVAVNYSVTGENIDWAVPVVYARNPGRMIYTQEEKDHVAAVLRPAVTRARSAPRRGFKGVRVGLWDVNHVLPELEEFVAALNGVQTDYSFRTVEVSAPLGTWRRAAPTSGGAAKGYIEGGEVASRLRDHVENLGVDRLICVTAFALADEQDRGLALWNEDPNEKVAIISGEPVFLQLEPGDPLLNRFLANMLVSALCGGEDHTTPPATCPNHFSADRESDPHARLAYLTASYRFCDACIPKLRGRPESLNRILAAW